MGRSIFDPIWREKEHAGRNSEMLHVLRGSVELVMRDASVCGREGDTLYTPAGAPHRDVFPPGSTFEVYLVHFDWRGEAEFLRRVPVTALTPAPPPVQAQLALQFQQLHLTFQQQGPMTRELCGLRLLTILLTLARHALTPRSTGADVDLGAARSRQIMQLARQHIQRHYHEPLGLDDIAAALHLSPYHLSHVFSEQSGFTLSSYLTQVRMEKAAELLRDGRLPIRAVAAAVGYRDPQYFARVFRSHFQASPSSFRVRGR
jgi:AraC-like DNA-binding protein